VVIETVPEVKDPRELALLKAVGLDKLSSEQRELALNIAHRYELDLLLKHLVLIEGRPYITRDGLLHIAHRSGFFDGMDTSAPHLEAGYWHAQCSVYRKDMTRPFTYFGRYPAEGRNKQFAPEMAVKAAESMALRRAFDIAAPSADERWDVPEPVSIEPPAPKPTLREVAAARVATVQEAAWRDDDAPPPTVPAEPEAVQAWPALSREEFRRIVAEEDLDDVKFTLTKSTTETLWPGRTEQLTDEERSVLLEVLRDRQGSK
jgi:hypothetical protein